MNKYLIFLLLVASLLLAGCCAECPPNGDMKAFCQITMEKPGAYAKSIYDGQVMCCYAYGFETNCEIYSLNETGAICAN